MVPLSIYYPTTWSCPVPSRLAIVLCCHRVVWWMVLRIVLPLSLSYDLSRNCTIASLSRWSRVGMSDTTPLPSSGALLWLLWWCAIVLSYWALRCVVSCCLVLSCGCIMLCCIVLCCIVFFFLVVLSFIVLFLVLCCHECCVLSLVFVFVFVFVFVSSNPAWSF